MAENMEMTFKGEIEFDTSDRASMLNLMAQYGDSEEMIFGDNERGESVQLSIFPTKIVLVTMQHNGWVRKNIYHRDFNEVEEIYEGRWT